MRGTVMVIGKGGKEIDLFVARLKKDGFEVDRTQEKGSSASQVSRTKPQAVFLTEHCSKSTIESVASTAKRFRTKIPVILLSNDPIDEQTKTKFVGEVFALHAISLAEAMRRLKFAIELCHLAFVR